jgi:hypothetical protein
MNRTARVAVWVIVALTLTLTLTLTTVVVAKQHATPLAPNGAGNDLALDIFNNPTGNTRVKLARIKSGDPRFEQWSGYDAKKLIYCGTSALINASPKRLVELIQGPWYWWKGGKQEQRKETPDGTDYWLYPAWAGVKVHEKMRKPEPYGNGGFVIRIDFVPDPASFAVGRAYFLIEPQANGKTKLSGRFAGVKSQKLPAKFFTETHLKGERGAMLPFGLMQSGWYHLIEIAEGREQLPTKYQFFGSPNRAAAGRFMEAHHKARRVGRSVSKS